jgi:hypothetical protein
VTVDRKTRTASLVRPALDAVIEASEALLRLHRAARRSGHAEIVVTTDDEIRTLRMSARLVSAAALRDFPPPAARR